MKDIDDEIARLHARRDALTARLADERVALFRAARQLRAPIETAQRWKRRASRATDWAPVAAIALGALLVLRRKRTPVRELRKPGKLSLALELWGLWRVASNTWHSFRPRRAF